MAYLEPGWFTRRLVNPLVRWIGGATTLVLPRRQSGRRQQVPVNVLDLAGARYLVGVRGETQWVRNLRVSGTGELRRRGRTEAFRSSEITDIEDKVRVIRAYRGHWGRQVEQYFRQLPDPGDHPVFRIDPA